MCCFICFWSSSKQTFIGFPISAMLCFDCWAFQRSRFSVAFYQSIFYPNGSFFSEFSFCCIFVRFSKFKHCRYLQTHSLTCGNSVGVCESLCFKTNSYFMQSVTAVDVCDWCCDWWWLSAIDDCDLMIVVHTERFVTWLWLWLTTLTCCVRCRWLMTSECDAVDDLWLMVLIDTERFMTLIAL